MNDETMSYATEILVGVAWFFHKCKEHNYLTD